MSKALVFYHYFHPDDVASAQQFSGLCEGLAQRGWQVTAMPCNRDWRDGRQAFPGNETWKGVKIRRIWRPRFRQSSSLGRILNAAWMTCAWCLVALRSAHAPDILIVGTDPVLSVSVCLFWRMVRPQVRIVHWCFDLYPEAAVADGLIEDDSLAVRIMKAITRRAYRTCDLIADIGPCMRARLKEYGSRAKVATLTPWALSEPSRPLDIDRSERAIVFGEDVRIGLMYSGSFGRAHSAELILQLARRLRGQGIGFVFSVRGNCAAQLESSIGASDINISCAPFAPQERIEARLSAADIHIVSLRPEWTGAVVPSKFFGALATGRPVVFVGSPESDIARWIEDYQVGWVLTAQTLPKVAKDILSLSRSRQDLIAMFERCHRVYGERFSRKSVLNEWDSALHSLLDQRG